MLLKGCHANPAGSLERVTWTNRWPARVGFARAYSRNVPRNQTRLKRPSNSQIPLPSDLRCKKKPVSRSRSSTHPGCEPLKSRRGRPQPLRGGKSGAEGFLVHLLSSLPAPLASQTPLLARLPFHACLGSLLYCPPTMTYSDPFCKIARLCVRHA
eukprot:3369166-Prymnesium_polylepis.1